MSKRGAGKRCSWWGVLVKAAGEGQGQYTMLEQRKKALGLCCPCEIPWQNGDRKMEKKGELEDEEEEEERKRDKERGRGVEKLGG